MTFVLLSQGAEALVSKEWNVTVPSTFRLFSVDMYSGLSLAQLQALTDSAFVEAAFPGYSSVPASSWPVTNGVATHSEITFEASESPVSEVPVHGYWVERNSDGMVIGFEVFETGVFVFQSAGSSLAFAPTITLS